MLIVEALSKNEYDNNTKYEYSYRLIKSNVKLLQMDSAEIESYGIEVERRDIVNDKLVKIERDSVKNISPHMCKVSKLLNMLYANTVSPIHLIDVLAEYIDEYVIDFDKILKDIYIC